MKNLKSPNIKLSIDEEEVQCENSIIAIVPHKDDTFNMVIAGSFQPEDMLNLLIQGVSEASSKAWVSKLFEDIFDDLEIPDSKLDEFDFNELNINLFSLLQFSIDKYIVEIRKLMTQKAFINLAKINEKYDIKEFSKKELNTFLRAFDIYLNNVISIDMKAFIKDVEEDWRNGKDA